MPWREVKPMDEKIMFIADCLRGGRTFVELCRSYGISRRIGYKWVGRYREGGIEALNDRLRRPKRSPQAIPYSVRKEIIAIRTRGRMKPGPKKIQSLLCTRHPTWDIPSKTTIYNIIRREGLVPKRKLRRHVPDSVKPFGPVQGPNDLWSADFKGQFLTGDGAWCFPLTLMDHASRYLLDCRALAGTRTGAVQAALRPGRRTGLHLAGSGDPVCSVESRRECVSDRAWQLRADGGQSQGPGGRSPRRGGDGPRPAHRQAHLRHCPEGVHGITVGDTAILIRAHSRGQWRISASVELLMFGANKMIIGTCAIYQSYSLKLRDSYHNGR